MQQTGARLGRVECLICSGVVGKELVVERMSHAKDRDVPFAEFLEPILYFYTGNGRYGPAGKSSGQPIVIDQVVLGPI